MYNVLAQESLEVKTSLKLPANSPAGFAFVNPKSVPLRFHN